MLEKLHIQNYALIESLDLDISEGFTVITGETGAGKSILLGAIGLLLGGRADSHAIQDGKNKCTIEATFNIKGCHLEPFFESENLDFDGQECIIRRELTSAGKSRAFINDTPATVSQLKTLGSQLIDIHSQHQNLLLGNEDFQISVLDIIAQNTALVQEYEQTFHEWKECSLALEEARQLAVRSKENEDYLLFQVTQLRELNPQPDEDETLQEECRKLEHADEIHSALLTGSEILDGEDASVCSVLRSASQQLDGISRFFPMASSLQERINTCRIEIQDIASTLSGEGENIECDPERLNQVQERLGNLYSLEQKHHAADSNELISILKRMEKELADINGSEENIQELEKKCSECHQKVLTAGKKLTSSRENAAREIEKKIVEMLHRLGMPNVCFHVDISGRKEPSRSGLDIINFMFSANKNSSLQPLHQIASGGEIARVMLSLKALISGAISLPTIIFDEIDTGVSGHIAEAMAKIMLEMGMEGRQVISITHLPQIAAMGQHHMRVYKEDTDQRTLSHITALTTEERINEIAHMLSGSEITTAALENAKTLLKL